MKILLLMPPCPPGMRYPRSVHPRFFPPLGIGYVASMLERAGHEVTISDLYLCRWSTIYPALDRGEFDIIGVSALFPSRSGVHRSIKLISQRRPKAKIIVGGPFAAVMADRFAANPAVSAVVVGEGEHTFPELVAALRDGSDLAQVKGIVFRRGGEVVRTPPRGFIQDLDSLPFPAFHLFDLKSYQRFWPGNFNVVSQFFRDSTMGRRWAPVLTTRACDFHCQFCAVHLTGGDKARSRSGKNVADEFQYLHDRFGYKNIFLQDAAFPIGSPLSDELCRELLNRKLRIRWATNARADMATSESLRLVKEAGCFYLLFGLESGSPDILGQITKRESLEQITDAVMRAHGLGIQVGIHILVGYPGENDRTIEQTIAVVRRLRPYIQTLYVRPLAVFPGTPLYFRVLAKSRLTEDDFFLPSANFFIFYALEHSPQQLFAWRDRIIAETAPFSLLRRVRDRLQTRGEVD